MCRRVISIWAGIAMVVCQLPAQLAWSGAGAPATDRDGAALQALYARHGSQPLWSSSGNPMPQARALVELLRHADDYGLRPGDYFIAAEPAGDGSADTALSAAALRFLRDVHEGRVDPHAAGFDLALPRPAFDAVASVEQLAAAQDPRAVIAAAEPPFYHYQLLKTALARYRVIAAGSPPPPLPPLPRRVVRPGEPYPDAAALRARLIASQDLDPAEALAGSDRTLDPALVAALRRFEARHQLDPDGVLGEAVLRELNTPVTQRIRQIELALERWRWLPPLREPPIIVNIPQFRLFAFRTTQDRAADILQMDVIVGQAYRRTQTPVFAGELKYVVFRPYWDVPVSIARREILPKLLRDPAYLDREHLELVAGPDDAAQVLPPTAPNLQRVGNGELRLRQRPGADNSLGLVKFILPNVHDVYLHGTPARQLFSRPVRAFSHGCIRVGDPAALAEFVLRDTPGEWTAAKVGAAMEGADSRRVDLTRPIPVMIVYTTALATEAGPVLFFHDIYGHDRELEKLLGLAPL
jgi:murein L,D-transpeptidase YcbB/YkuD